MEMKNNNLSLLLALIVGVGIGYFFIGAGMPNVNNQKASSLDSDIANNSLIENRMSSDSIGQGDFFAMASDMEKNKLDEQVSNNLVQTLTESVANFAMQNNLALTPTGGSNKYFCLHLAANVFWTSNTNWGANPLFSNSVFCYSIGN